MQSNINKLTKKIEELIVFSKELRKTNSDLIKKLATSEDEKKHLQEKINLSSTKLSKLITKHFEKIN